MLRAKCKFLLEVCVEYVYRFSKVNSNDLKSLFMNWNGVLYRFSKVNSNDLKSLFMNWNGVLYCFSKVNSNDLKSLFMKWNGVSYKLRFSNLDIFAT